MAAFPTQKPGSYLFRSGLGLVVACLGGGLIGCEWSRFDDVLEEPPVEIIERSGSSAVGFGQTLGGAASPAGGVLFISGEPGISDVVSVSLGSSSSPVISPAKTQWCPVTNADCRGVGSLGAELQPGCFVVGVGQINGQVGLRAACADSDQSSLVSVPALYSQFLAENVLKNPGITNFPPTIASASLGNTHVIASPEVPLVWTYTAGGAPEVVAPRPANADGTYATAVALAGGSAAEFLAVSAPGQGRVYIFEKQGSGWSLRRCIEESPPFGVRIDGLTTPGARFVLSDGAGKVLALDPTRLGSDLACAPLTPAENALELSCAGADELSGCEKAAFGYSLAHGDLDGDGEDEVLVGAPGMDHATAANAGAVMAYTLSRATGAGAAKPMGHFYLAQPKRNDRLGQSVTTVPVGERSVVASGLIGRQAVALFHCFLGGTSGVYNTRCR